jgi:AcrR family transcriptional regulator
MPRPADPAVRERLLDAAAGMLVRQEPLSLRRLAADVGTSTMAVYTHFGGMDELMREVRREGFQRLAEHLADVHSTSDPIADLAALGWAYCLNAVENPTLYRAMFFETTADLTEASFGASTFLPVVDAVERAIAKGRITATTPWDPAVQLWMLAHGAVSLALGGMLTVEDLVHHLEGGITIALAGYGDDPRAITRSLRAARRRMLAPEGLPQLPNKGATLAAATDAARR